MNTSPLASSVSHSVHQCHTLHMNLSTAAFRNPSYAASIAEARGEGEFEGSLTERNPIQREFASYLIPSGLIKTITDVNISSQSQNVGARTTTSVIKPDFTE